MKPIKLYKDNVVTKSNDLVEAKYKLSYREQKFILLMTSHISPSDKDFFTFQMQAGDLIKALGMEKESDAHRRLVDVIEGLQTSLVRVYDREQKKEIVSQWVGSCSYNEGGEIEFAFSHHLKPYLLGLKERFTSLKYSQIVQLPSTYAIRFYELLKQYEKVGKRVMTIDQIRSMMGLEDDQYPLYGNLRQRVIEVARKAVNRTTDITFDYKPIKEGRKVVALAFSIRKKRPNPSPDTESATNLFDLLVSIGVTRKSAKHLLNKEWEAVKTEHRDEAQKGAPDFSLYVAEKIEMMRLDGSVENPPAWIMEAIRSNWETKKHQQAKKEAEKRQKHRANEARRVMEQAEKNEEMRREKERNDRLVNVYTELSQSEKAVVHEQVLDLLIKDLTKDEKNGKETVMERVRAFINQDWETFKSELEKTQTWAHFMANAFRNSVVEDLYTSKADVEKLQEGQ